MRRRRRRRRRRMTRTVTYIGEQQGQVWESRLTIPTNLKKGIISSSSSSSSASSSASSSSSSSSISLISRLRLSLSPCFPLSRQTLRVELPSFLHVSIGTCLSTFSFSFSLKLYSPKISTQPSLPQGLNLTEHHKNELHSYNYLTFSNAFKLFSFSETQEKKK